MLKSERQHLPVLIKADDLSFFMPGLTELAQSAYLQRQFDAAVSGPKEYRIKLRDTITLSWDGGISRQRPSETMRVNYDCGYIYSSQEAKSEVSVGALGFSVNMHFLDLQHIVIRSCNFDDKAVGLVREHIDVSHDINADPVHEQLIYTLFFTALSRALPSGTLPSSSEGSKHSKFLGLGLKAAADLIASKIESSGHHGYERTLYYPVRVGNSEDVQHYNMLHPGVPDFVHNVVTHFALSQGHKGPDKIIRKSDIPLLDVQPSAPLQNHPSSAVLLKYEGPETN